MKSDELLRSGDLEQTLVQLQNEVRNDPSNFKLRVFLFQLLTVTGQWDRALNQLNVAGELDAMALPMVQTYREAIRCEFFRQQVFQGQRTPVVFGKPQAWVAHLLESFRLFTAGSPAESQLLRETAFDEAPAQSGRIFVGSSGPENEGIPFEWIADADLRLGPILEVVMNGRYYWIPMENIRVLQIDPPEDLRDVVWMPAHLQWTNGGESVALLPTRYPGSEASSDSRIRLSQKTEWNEVSPDLFVGMGQRMLATDAGDFPMMEVRKIVFDAPPAVGEVIDG